jgi:anti-sigma factor RsiW
MNVDSCARWRALGSRALDCELGELDAARLERHLLECAACAGWLAEVRDITGLLRAAELERPEQVFRLRPLRSARLRVGAAGATAASIAAAALVALTLHLPSSATPGPSSSSAARANVISSPVLMWRSGHGALATAFAGASHPSTPQHVVNPNVAS